MARKVYVYALDIVYPEEANLALWAEDTGYEGHQFSWHRDRRFLSESSAVNRANYLRRYGADVVILRSEPIVFPTGASVRQDRDEAIVRGLRRLELVTRSSPGNEILLP